MRPTAEYWRKLNNALKSPGLGLLLRSAGSEKKNLLLPSLFSAIHAVLGLCMTLVMKEMVDAAVSGSAEGLLRAALLLAGVILLLLGLGYLRRMADVRARAGLLRRLRREAMETLLRKQYGALQGYHSGELVNHLFSDIRIVADGILGILPPLLFLFVQLVGASVILYRMSPGFMAILLAAGALGSAAAFLLRTRSNPSTRKINRRRIGCSPAFRRSSRTCASSRPPARKSAWSVRRTPASRSIPISRSATGACPGWLGQGSGSSSAQAGSTR